MNNHELKYDDKEYVFVELFESNDNKNVNIDNENIIDHTRKMTKSNGLKLTKHPFAKSKWNNANGNSTSTATGMKFQKVQCQDQHDNVDDDDDNFSLSSFDLCDEDIMPCEMDCDVNVHFDTSLIQKTGTAAVTSTTGTGIANDAYSLHLSQSPSASASVCSERMFDSIKDHDTSQNSNDNENDSESQNEDADSDVKMDTDDLTAAVISTVNNAKSTTTTNSSSGTQAKKKKEPSSTPHASTSTTATLSNAVAGHSRLSNKKRRKKIKKQKKAAAAAAAVQSLAAQSHKTSITETTSAVTKKTSTSSSTSVNHKKTTSSSSSSARTSIAVLCATQSLAQYRQEIGLANVNMGVNVTGNSPLKKPESSALSLISSI